MHPLEGRYSPPRLLHQKIRKGLTFYVFRDKKRYLLTIELE
jgi:hypothetical protein